MKKTRHRTAKQFLLEHVELFECLREGLLTDLSMAARRRERRGQHARACTQKRCGKLTIGHVEQFDTGLL